MELLSKGNELSCLLPQFLLINFNRVVLKNVLGVLFQDSKVIPTDIVSPYGIELVSNLVSLWTLFLHLREIGEDSVNKFCQQLGIDILLY